MSTIPKLRTGEYIGNYTLVGGIGGFYGGDCYPITGIKETVIPREQLGVIRKALSETKGKDITIRIGEKQCRRKL